ADPVEIVLAWRLVREPAPSRQSSEAREASRVAARVAPATSGAARQVATPDRILGRVPRAGWLLGVMVLLVLQLVWAGYSVLHPVEFPYRGMELPLFTSTRWFSSMHVAELPVIDCDLNAVQMHDRGATVLGNWGLVAEWQQLQGPSQFGWVLHTV